MVSYVSKGGISSCGWGEGGETRRAYLFARGVDVLRRCLVAFFISRSSLLANIISGAKLHVGVDQVVAYAGL